MDSRLVSRHFTKIIQKKKKFQPTILEASRNRGLKRVFLGDNKIVCDARISDFAPYLGYKARKDDEIRELIAADEVECYYPSETSGKSLVELDYPNLPSIGSFGVSE